MFVEQILSSEEVMLTINTINHKPENMVVIKNIGNSIELLLNSAIKGTRAFKLLDQMRELCLEKSCNYDAQKHTSTEAIRYVSFIYKYVSTGNIPMAFSAVAPWFLFDRGQGPHSRVVKKEVANFLNVIAEDQTMTIRKSMEEIMLNSIKIYASINDSECS